LKFEIRDNKDFWAGALLIAVGGGAALVARSYPMGTALRMGAGYFPLILSLMLAGFGLLLLAKSIRSTTKIEPGWSLRALVVLPLVLAAFGFLLERAGFIPAMAVLIFGSAAAGRDFRFIEVLALFVVLTALSTLVFIWGLGLPYPLIAGLR
jgi:Tripartite tricarboxylate transporter TctB family